MIRDVYCIRDVLNGFLSPIIETNRDTAIRNFKFAVNNPNNEIINFVPSDYELYFLGTFNQETGMFDCRLPELVVRGSDVFASV